ncbi:MAG TPA: PQQ-binding-like beta-propeller repeat protein, partial [Actinomycetota bacterium]
SLVGVDLGTRRELWRTRLGAQSRSGVTIDGPRVFAGDENGNVVAVELQTGALRWKAKAQGEILTPPAVADGRVYVVAHDTSAGRSQLVAFDERSGRRAWPAYSAPVAGSTVSGAAAVAGVVVVGFADRIVRELAADGGNLRWEELALSYFSPASMPAVAGGDVYIADVAAGLYRLNAETGSRRWDYQFNDLVIRSSPVVSGSTVLLGLDDGRLVAVDVRSGDLVWQSEPSSGLLGAIALSHQVVVAVRGGEHPGLVAFVHDAEGRLVHVPSPTVVDAGALVGNFAIALVVVFGLLFVPFRVLARRTGSSRPSVDEDESGHGEDEEEDDAG